MKKIKVRIIFVHTSKGFLTGRKILPPGAKGFTSSPVEGVLRIVIVFKIHRPLPRMNPRTLGPMADTLAIAPPTDLMVSINISHETSMFFPESAQCIPHFIRN